MTCDTKIKERRLVYGYVCKLEGKYLGWWYIGITKYINRKNRHRDHKAYRSGCPKFNDFVKKKIEVDKYRFKDLFKRVVLDSIVCDNNDAELIEIEYQKKYDSVENGFNCKYGGYNGSVSENTIQKMRDTWSDPELRRRHSEILKDAWNRNGARDNQSEVMKRIHADPEVKKKHKKAVKKGVNTPEAKANRSRSSKKHGAIQTE